ncbi:MAG: translocation/assembly module TamB domain-containing protein [Luteolibacter sp.]
MSPKRRGKYRRWLVLVLLALGLVWLNGPGLRWLAPQIATRFLEKAGLRGTFQVHGNLVGGISISDLEIEGDHQLARLTIDQLTPHYRWRGLFRGQLDGLAADGVHADLRLGLENASEEKPPLDFKALVETLRSARSRVVPLALDLKRISLAATRRGEQILTLAPSRLYHPSGSEDFLLEIGALTDATGREWPAQKSSVVWRMDEISVERIDPFPGVSVRELLVPLPAGGGPSVEAEVHLDEAVFVVSSEPGFTTARVDLREGKLQVRETAKRLGLEIPATATLTSLAIELENILPAPKAANGTVRLLLEDLVWQDWSVPELSLDVALTVAQATIAARGRALGTEFSFDTTAPLTREENSFTVGDASGKFNLADVPSALRGLAPQVPAIDPEAPVPPSSMDGNFTVNLVANQARAAAADLLLKPQDEELASPVAIKARWTQDQPLSADLVLDGLSATGSYQTEPGVYQATADFDEFTSTRIERWLAIVRVKPGGVASLSGKWSGGGEWKTGRHRGDLSLTGATWKREAAPPITAIGSMKYDWPAGFETRGLRVKMNEQTVVLGAALSGGLLDFREFLWSDGATELASGTASLPVPADFSKWRDTLANDTRALSVSINSRVLSLALLKPWVPALEKLDPRSTGKLDISITGNFSAPVVDATFEARDLRSPAQPKLPPADLKITLAGRDGRFVLDGSATAPDFAPAVFRADMPFRPADWAAAPGSIQDEPLNARIDLPRLDLSRFSTLVPAARQLTGIVTGNVVVAGVLGKPTIQGTLDLASAGLSFQSNRFPGIEGVTGKLDFALDRVVLRNLRGTSAGGSFQAEGALDIAAGKLGNLDMRLRGDHLLLLRNDLLILRANADLRLLGPWENATLSGTVGAVDSIFYRDIELLPIGSPFTTPAAARVPKFDVVRAPTAVVIPEPFKNWGLNVQVRSQDPVLIRGNFATGEITGGIAIGGTLGNPSPNGSVRISDFRAALPFSTLSVPSGTATFTPATGFDPILEIRGTAEPRPYRVTLYVYGRSSDPQLILTSTPPMPENEIMTLLATGTTTQGLVNPQAASARALQLLAEEIRRGRFRFGRQLRPLLALLDNVDFNLDESDPYSSDSYSTATISLTDRWLLSAGVGATGDTRGLVIWRLSFR